MANKRILYASEALFVGPTPATGTQASGSMIQIQRVNTFSHDWTVTRVDVPVFGQYAPIDRVIIDLPVVNIGTTYLATNVRNESGIGLYVAGDQSALKYILDDTQKEKNYYLRIVPDGNDAVGYAGTDGGVMGFGNGVLASYQAQGQVGGFPTAQFSVNALNANYSTISSGFVTPAVDPSNGATISGIFVTLPVAVSGQAGQSTALRPGDITVALLDGSSIATAGIGTNNICIQSYNIQFDLSLEPLICLGSKYPTSREIKFPINCQFSVDALMKDLGTGNLNTLSCSTANYNIAVTLRAPTCDPNTLGAVKAMYILKGATLDSEKFNDTIGPSKSVTMEFTAPIGGANDTLKGLFISGSIA